MADQVVNASDTNMACMCLILGLQRAVSLIQMFPLPEDSHRAMLWIQNWVVRQRRWGPRQARWAAFRP
jgi:hypothetical protein